MTATLFDNETSTTVRPLGSLEHLFWKMNRTTPAHFVMAAHVEGHTTRGNWRIALAEVQKRHPLLSVCIEESPTPHFRRVPENPIPLGVIESASATLNWKSAFSKEMAIPIDSARAPLIRALLLLEADRAVLILACHHSVGDGISLTFIVRDLLQSLSGQPIKRLPVAPPMDKLLESSATETTAAPSESNPTEPMEPTPYRTKDGSAPCVRTLRLEPELTTALRERARQEGTTVHGALAAAITLAIKQNSAELGDKPIRVVSPIDIRGHLGLVDESMVSVTAAPTVLQPDMRTPFWDVARFAISSLAPAQTLEGTKAFIGALTQLMSTNPDANAVAHFISLAFGQETMLSNLGNLRFDTTFGALKLDALYGPGILRGFENEQYIGVTTSDRGLCFLETSFNPIPSLLETTRQILVSAVANQQPKVANFRR